MERTDFCAVPGKAVQGHAYAVFSQEISYVLKENIKMPGEETGLGTGRLAEQIVYPPYPDRVITVKGKRRRIGGYAGPPEIAGSIGQPAGRVPKKTVKTLNHADWKREAELIDKRTVRAVCTEGENAVFIEDDAETAVHHALIL